MNEGRRKICHSQVALVGRKRIRLSIYFSHSSVLFEFSKIVFLVRLMDFSPPVDSLKRIFCCVDHADVSVVDIAV